MLVESEEEEDGRWIAEVASVPGAMVYGATKPEAVAKVDELVIRILADKVEHGEELPQIAEAFPGQNRFRNRDS